MEPKVIFYIIIGILYFLYSMSKKAEEKKNVGTPPKQKPVTPPGSFGDIFQEIKRMQAAEEAKKRPVEKPLVKPMPTAQPVIDKGKEVFLHERKVKTDLLDSTWEETVYERDATPEEKSDVGKLKLANEGIYKIETIEEAEAREMQEYELSYKFNARDALIGSIILERKY